MAKFVKVLVNDVVYYLHLNNGNSTKESIINACMKEFSETEILNAKAYLLEECSLDIRKLNNVVASDVSTVRINSCNRTRLVAVIEDIVKIINLFEGSNCAIEVRSKGPHKISKIIPEKMDIKAILERLTAAESKLVT